MANHKHILRYNLREKRYYRFDVVRDILLEIGKEEYHTLKKENEDADKASTTDNQSQSTDENNNP
jgi:hypothetical protein